jgi:hypothetical protein
VVSGPPLRSNMRTPRGRTDVHLFCFDGYPIGNPECFRIYSSHVVSLLRLTVVVMPWSYLSTYEEQPATVSNNPISQSDGDDCEDESRED